MNTNLCTINLPPGEKCGLGVYVNDFDIRPDQLESAAQRIRQWLDQYLVVVVRGQLLEATEQRDLVAHFGPLFYHHADEGVIHAQGLPEVLEMRKEADGARLFGGSDWHADVTFRHRWQDGDLVFWDNRFTLHDSINMIRSTISPGTTACYYAVLRLRLEPGPN